MGAVADATAADAKDKPLVILPPKRTAEQEAINNQFAAVAAELKTTKLNKMPTSSTSGDETKLVNNEADKNNDFATDTAGVTDLAAKTEDMLEKKAVDAGLSDTAGQEDE